MVVSYDLRYSKAIITAQNFDLVASFDCGHVPGSPGSEETCTVVGLDAGTTYHFAVKSRDNDGNRSAISNIVAAATNPAGTGAWVAFEANPNAYLLGNVKDLAVYNGVLYVLGENLGMAGIGLGNIVYWSGERWFTAGDLGPVLGVPSQLFVMGGELHATHTYLGTRYISSWDGQTWGTLLAPHSGINGLTSHSSIDVKYSDANCVIVTGPELRENFNRDLGRCARWDGSTWEKFAEELDNYPFGGTPEAISRRPDGSFALAGTFQDIIADPPHTGVVSWDDVLAQPIGGAFSRAGGLPAYINILHEFNGGLLAFGNFEYIGGLTPIQSPAFWDGVSWVSFFAPLPGGAWGIMNYGETLVASSGPTPARLEGNAWVPMGNPGLWVGGWPMLVFGGDLVIFSHNLAEQRSGLWRWVE